MVELDLDLTKSDIHHSEIELKTGVSAQAGRGGAREGAGRKKIQVDSVTVRVPSTYIHAIRALIEMLDTASEFGGTASYDGAVSPREIQKLDSEILVVEITAKSLPIQK